MSFVLPGHLYKFQICIIGLSQSFLLPRLNLFSFDASVISLRAVTSTHLAPGLRITAILAGLEVSPKSEINVEIHTIPMAVNEFRH